MGLEAYRIEFETINPTNRADILDIFANIGFSVMGENFSDLYLEKAYDWGFIEIALQNPELHRLAMNNYVKQNNYGDLVDIHPLDIQKK